MIYVKRISDSYWQSMCVGMEAKGSRHDFLSGYCPVLALPDKGSLLNHPKICMKRTQRGREHDKHITHKPQGVY